MRVNRRSTLVLKPFISSDSQKLANILSGCWRICNHIIIIIIIDRLLLQNLLYTLPDMKTQETPSGKNWERISQANATAQTLGV